MEMVFVKFRNAAELFWESLDAQERRLLMLGAVWVVMTGLSLVGEKAEREQERARVAQLVTEELDRRGRAR